MLTAMQGGLTLELAREHRPDLIVLDQHSPTSRVTRCWRSFADRGPRGYRWSCAAPMPPTGGAQQLLDAGARAYLTKPVKVQRFLRMLDEVLREPPDAGLTDARWRIRRSTSLSVPRWKSPSASRRYTGSPAFPRPARPYIVANFVSTIDGVVSLGVSDGTDSSTVGAGSEADRYVMAMLRAAAGAVVIGAGTPPCDAGTSVDSRRRRR